MRVGVKRVGSKARVNIGYVGVLLLHDRVNGCPMVEAGVVGELSIMI